MTSFALPATSLFHLGLKGQTPDHVFKFLAWEIAKKIQTVPAIELHERFDGFYQGQSAGIGDGIALFDWKQEIREPIFSLARLQQPIFFKAPDDRPVDVIVTMISPEKQGQQHLTHVARLSRLLREEGLMTRIRAAIGPDELAALLVSGLPDRMVA